MRTLYFDCFSGASGDMLLGALVDLGVDPVALEAELCKLAIGDFRLETSRVQRSGLSAAKVDVVVGGQVEGPHGAVLPHGGDAHGHGHDHGRAQHHDHGHSHGHGGSHHDHGHGAHGREHPGHGTHGGEAASHGAHGDEVHGHGHSHGRGPAEIVGLIASSGLSELTKRRAVRIFERLAEAEAKMHGTTPDQVHFHEVGAVDAIVDVVGACVGFEMLGVEQFVCSPLNVGGGSVTFSHGTYPVPAPATAELLRGAPIVAGEPRKELVTPTGAAIITTVSDAYGPLPEMRVERIGYGAGSRDFPRHPNVLRLMLGEARGLGADKASNVVAVIEAAVDDMPAEALGFFVERALDEGALDVYLTPAQMKKNRPGVELTLLAEAGDLERMVRLVFRETTTIGLRHRLAERRVLDRERVSVQTPVGPIRVKVARLGGEVVNAAPEYDDCREAALRSGLPLREVQALASAAYREGVAGR
jgi:uncharacterized protein (TIGR00299 family) protein